MSDGAPIHACPRCDAQLRLASEPPAGAFRLRCPNCGEVFTVGAAPVAPLPPPPPAASPRSPANATPGGYGPAWVCEPRADFAGRLADGLRAVGFIPEIIAGANSAAGSAPPRLAFVSAYHIASGNGIWLRLLSTVPRPRLVLLGEIHSARRYHRPPDGLYGADAYFEEPADPSHYESALRECLGLSPPAAAAVEDDAGAMTLARELFTEMLLDQSAALGAMDSAAARAHCAPEMASRRAMLEQTFPGRGPLIDSLFESYLRLKG